MAALPENDRIAGPFLAVAGQVDFPADFPLIKAEGLRVRRDRSGVTEVLSGPAVAAVNVGPSAFTARLSSPSQAGDRLWVYSELPAARLRAHSPNGAVRTPTLEDDAEEFQGQLQEVRRDLGRTLKSAPGEPSLELPAATGRGDKGVRFDAAGRMIAVTEARWPDDLSSLSGKPLALRGDGRVGEALMQPATISDDRVFAAAAAAARGAPFVLRGGGEYVVNEPADIQGALDDLAAWTIRRDARAIIKLPAGRVAASTFTIDLNSGDRVGIRGDGFDDLTFTGLISIVSNGAGSHDVMLQFAAVAGADWTVSPSDSLRCTGITGTGAYAWLNGVWEVIAVDAGAKVVTLRVTARKPVWPATTITGGVFRRHRTDLVYAAASSGLVARRFVGDGSGIQASIDALCMVGNGLSNAACCFMEPHAMLVLGQTFSARKWGGYGIRTVSTGNFQALNTVFSNINGAAFYSLGGGLGQAVGAIASGCNGAGFVCSNGASMAASNSISCGNLRGYEQNDGGNLTHNNSLADGNANEGALASNMGMLKPDGSVIRNNGNYGVRVFSSAEASVVNCTVTGHSIADLAAFGGAGGVVSGGAYGTIDPPLNFEGRAGACWRSTVLPTDRQRSTDMTVGVNGTRKTEDRSIIVAVGPLNIPANGEQVLVEVPWPGLLALNGGFAAPIINGAVVPGLWMHVRPKAGVNDVAEVVGRNMTGAAIVTGARSLRVTGSLYA